MVLLAPAPLVALGAVGLLGVPALALKFGGLGLIAGSSGVSLLNLLDWLNRQQTGTDRNRNKRR